MDVDNSVTETDECSDKTRRFSNQPFDYTTYRCEMCEFVGDYDKICGHIRNIHKLMVSEYKCNYKFVIVDNVWHQCRICDRKLRFSRLCLRSHLLPWHKLSLEEYFKDSIPTSVVSSSTSTDNKAMLQSPGAMSKCLNDHTVDENLLDTSEPDKSLDCVMDVDNSVTETDECSDKTRRFSNQPFDYTTYRCEMCEFVGDYDKICGHIRNIHKLMVSEYKCNYKFVIVDNVWHQCRICDRKLRFSRLCLRSHLLPWHKLSLEEYFKDSIPTSVVSSSTSTNSKAMLQSAVNAVENETKNNSPLRAVKCKTANRRKIRTRRSTSIKIIKTTESCEVELKQCPKNQFKSDLENLDPVQEPVEAREWYEGRTLKCLHCQFTTFALPLMKKHVTSKHSSVETKAHKQRRESCDDSSTSQHQQFTSCGEETHRCEFCEMEVAHDELALQHHLEQHFLTLKVYYELYLLPQREYLAAKKRTNRPLSDPSHTTAATGTNVSKEPTNNSKILLGRRLSLTSRGRGGKASTNGFSRRRKASSAKKQNLETKSRRTKNNYQEPEERPSGYLTPVPPLTTSSEDEDEKQMRKKSPAAGGVAAVAKRRRGRPPGSKNKPKNSVGQSSKYRKVDQESNASSSESSSDDESIESNNSGHSDAENEDSINGGKARSAGGEVCKPEFQFRGMTFDYPLAAYPVPEPIEVEDINCLVLKKPELIKDDHIHLCPVEICAFQVTMQGLKSGVACRHLLDTHGITFIEFKKSGMRWRRVSLEEAMDRLYT